MLLLIILSWPPNPKNTLLTEVSHSLKTLRHLPSCYTIKNQNMSRRKQPIIPQKCPCFPSAVYKYAVGMLRVQSKTQRLEKTRLFGLRGAITAPVRTTARGIRRGRRHVPRRRGRHVPRRRGRHVARGRGRHIPRGGRVDSRRRRVGSRRRRVGSRRRRVDSRRRRRVGSTGRGVGSREAWGIGTRRTGETGTGLNRVGTEAGAKRGRSWAVRTAAEAPVAVTPVAVTITVAIAVIASHLTIAVAITVLASTDTAHSSVPVTALVLRAAVLVSIAVAITPAILVAVLVAILVAVLVAILIAVLVTVLIALLVVVGLGGRDWRGSSRSWHNRSRLSGHKNGLGQSAVNMSV
ncbi:hypothetical protein LY78DRAFT_182328 [Colletotrichum sublineola]|nr:hypothetical protein LY78DRAFT_182328 [Colletotrichum sublineola]